MESRSQRKCLTFEVGLLGRIRPFQQLLGLLQVEVHGLGQDLLASLSALVEALLRTQPQGPWTRETIRRQEKSQRIEEGGGERRDRWAYVGR